MTTPKESTIGPTGPSYSERMETFPDVNEDLEKYAANQEMQKAFNLYFKKVKALNMRRTYRARVTSWGTPEPHRPDGSPLTKPSRASRAAVSHRKSKAAKLARAKNR